jgi:cell shape-determining protein MreC
LSVARGERQRFGGEGSMGALDFFLVKCAKGRASFDEVRRWTSPPQKLPESVINHVEEIMQNPDYFSEFFFQISKKYSNLFRKIMEIQNKNTK